MSSFLRRVNTRSGLIPSANTSAKRRTITTSRNSRTTKLTPNILENEPFLIKEDNKLFTVVFLEVEHSATSPSHKTKKFHEIGGSHAKSGRKNTNIGHQFFFINQRESRPMNDVEIVGQLELEPDIQGEQYLHLLQEKVAGRQYTRKNPKNKGEFGSMIEKMCNLKPDSKLCDFMTNYSGTPMTGDAKGLTVSSKSYKTGNLNAKETTKVTMIKKTVLEAIKHGQIDEEYITWKNSFIYKKIQNIIFIPYIRDSAPSKKRPGKDSPDKGETATFLEPIVVSEETHLELYNNLEIDFYDILRQYKHKQGSSGTITGKKNMLQIRTAGSGNKDTRNYAFYLTKNCTNKLLKRGSQRHSLFSVAAEKDKPAQHSLQSPSMSMSLSSPKELNSTSKLSLSRSNSKGTRKRRRRRRRKKKRN